MSLFAHCQNFGCTEIAEYKCSCSHSFCNTHYQRHYGTLGSNHRANPILLPLEESQLGFIRDLKISILVESLINQEITRRQEKVQSLFNQIKEIEKESSFRLEKICQKGTELQDIICQVAQQQKIPRSSHNHMATELRKLIEQMALTHKNIIALFDKQVHQPLQNLPPESQISAPEFNFEKVTLLYEKRGHSSMIRAIAVSPDKTMIASGSEDHCVKIWDVHSGAHISTLDVHTNSVRTLNFDPKSELLVTGSSDHSAIVWQLKTLTPICIYKRHDEWVLSACFSTDSRLVASGGGDSKLHIWAVSNPSNGTVLSGHSNYIRNITFTEDAKTVISGGDDGEIIVWDTRTGYIIKNISSSFGSVIFFYYRDNVLFTTYSENKSIHLWNIQTGEYIKQMGGFNKIIDSIDLSESGKFMVSGGRDHTLKIWKDCSIVKTIRNVKSPRVVFAGNKIVAGDGDGFIRIWG